MAHGEREPKMEQYSLGRRGWAIDDAKVALWLGQRRDVAR